MDCAVLISLAEKLFANASVIIMSLIICLGMAYLADLVGLSSVIGAFFAGSLLAKQKSKKKWNTV